MSFKTYEEYEAALQEIYSLMQDVQGTADGARLDSLVNKVMDYEALQSDDEFFI